MISMTFSMVKSVTNTASKLWSCKPQHTSRKDPSAFQWLRAWLAIWRSQVNLGSLIRISASNCRIQSTLPFDLDEKVLGVNVRPKLIRLDSTRFDLDLFWSANAFWCFLSHFCPRRQILIKFHHSLIRSKPQCRCHDGHAMSVGWRHLWITHFNSLHSSKTFKRGPRRLALPHQHSCSIISIQPKTSGQFCHVLPCLAMSCHVLPMTKAQLSVHKMCLMPPGDCIPIRQSSS